MITRHDGCCRGRREESREATSSKWRAKREGEETREKVREMIEKRDADNRAVDRVCCTRSDVEEARR